MSDPSPYRQQAVEHVRADTRRQHDHQQQRQQGDRDRLDRERQREVEAFQRNRDEAIRQHWQLVRRENAREARDLKRLWKQQNSIGGRMRGLIDRKGQACEWQAVIDRYDDRRMQHHRSLATLQERQQTQEQQARTQYQGQCRALNEKHVQNSRILTQQLDATKESRIEDAKQERHRQAEQALKLELQKLNGKDQQQEPDQQPQQKKGLTRSFNQ